jgi:hypothetical protein
MVSHGTEKSAKGLAITTKHAFNKLLIEVKGSFEPTMWIQWESKCDSCSMKKGKQSVVLK